MTDNIRQLRRMWEYDRWKLQCPASAIVSASRELDVGDKDRTTTYYIGVHYHFTKHWMSYAIRFENMMVTRVSEIPNEKKLLQLLDICLVGYQTGYKRGHYVGETEIQNNLKKLMGT